LVEHLNENQIINYGRQELSAAELLIVSDHLGTCEACRRQVETALNGDAAFFAMRSEVFGPTVEIAALTHPPFEQIADYVEGMSAGEERQVVKDHLISCEQCTVAVNDLRAFRNQVAPNLNREYHPGAVHSPSKSRGQRFLSFLPSTLWKSRLAFSSALAVLLLMVTGWLVWQARQKRDSTREIVIVTPTPTAPLATPGLAPTAPPTPGPEIVAVPVIAQLNDGGGEDRLILDREGKLSGADHLPPTYQRMVKEALLTQRLTKSSLLAGLNRPASSLMSGTEQSNRFSVIGPVGKVMESDRPTFRWSRLEGAKSYVVEVYDDKFNLVTTSPELVANSWTAPQSLKRGGIYSWQVKAIKDGQEFRSPRPPAPQAKFRILDQAKVNELAQAKRAYGSSHLALGLLYTQAGLLDEAEQEFRALQKSNPDSAIVRRLLSQVQKLRS
jgi:anti-sigma factor RsiW